ncbi:hypothetical protein QYM36_007644, partial [Artemia franciscana]
YGALAPLSSLRIFRGSIYKDVRGFSIASLVRHNSALRSLYIDVEDSILDKQLHGVLPQKLGNITITGKSLKSFGKSPFKDLSSRCLQLHITNTSLQNIERSVFKDMGATKWLKLDVTGNNLKQMAEPYTTLYPGSPYSTFLLELEISGNEWNCDCAIGWVEYWMKKWRQHDFALEQEHEILENHQKQKRDFRIHCKYTNLTSTSPDSTSLGNTVVVPCGLPVTGHVFYDSRFDQYLSCWECHTYDQYSCYNCTVYGDRVPQFLAHGVSSPQFSFIVSYILSERDFKIV